MNSPDLITDLRYWKDISEMFGQDLYVGEDENGSSLIVKGDEYILAHPYIDGKVWYIRKESKFTGEK